MPPPAGPPRPVARARLLGGLAVGLFRLIAWLAGRLPLPAGYWLAGALGQLYCWLRPGHSRHAVDNMAVVLAQHRGSQAARRLASASFRHYVMSLLDFARLPRLTPQTVERGVASDGWEHLDAALAGGRGAIVVTTHIGSWDRAAALLGPRGYRAHLLVDSFQPPALDEAIQRMRTALGVGIIRVEGRGGLRHVYAALRRNEIVVLLVDRPLRERGVPVQFFGRPTWLPGGAATLALRTGAPLLHAYLVRRPGLLTYQGAIEPIQVPPQSPESGRVEQERAIMQAIVSCFERIIQQHPEQWYMFRPMWPGADETSRDAPTEGDG